MWTKTRKNTKIFYSLGHFYHHSHIHISEFLDRLCPVLRQNQDSTRCVAKSSQNKTKWRFFMQKKTVTPAGTCLQEAFKTWKSKLPPTHESLISAWHPDIFIGQGSGNNMSILWCCIIFLQHHKNQTFTARNPVLVGSCHSTSDLIQQTCQSGEDFQSLPLNYPSKINLHAFLKCIYLNTKV